MPSSKVCALKKHLLWQKLAAEMSRLQLEIQTEMRVKPSITLQ